MVDFLVSGVRLSCETKPDLFSPKGLDSGTRILLESVPKVLPDYQSAIDWGCGWGAIGITLAKCNSKAEIIALDSDIAAVSTAQANKELNGATNLVVIASHGFDQVEADKKFDLITSNPPTHRGREVVETMISQSLTRLNNDAVLLIVIEARLKPWVARQMKEVFGNYRIVKRSPKHVVLKAVKMVQ